MSTLRGAMVAAALASAALLCAGCATGVGCTSQRLGAGLGQIAMLAALFGGHVPVSGTNYDGVAGALEPIRQGETCSNGTDGQPADSD